MVEGGCPSSASHRLLRKCLAKGANLAPSQVKWSWRVVAVTDGQPPRPGHWLKADNQEGSPKGRRFRVSALGQKQTFAMQKGMSALPPIATSIAFFGMSALGQKR